MTTLAGRLRRWGGRRFSAQHKLIVSKLRHREYAWQRVLTGGARQQFSAAPERGYSALSSVRSNLHSVLSLLTSAGIDSVRLPQHSEFNPVVVVRGDRIDDVLQALSRLERREGWTIELTDAHETVIRSRWGRVPRRDDVARINVSRKIVADNGRTLSTRFERVFVEPWEVLAQGVKRVDGGEHEPGTLHRRLSLRGTFIEYLTPTKWADALNAGGCLEWDSPHLYDVDGPIDVVYTWVDGADPDWRERKLCVQGTADSTNLNETATIDARFTSRDELKYSLRSLEAYADWVNHIYIVTDQQTPEWLDTDHPKITVVDHREIFRDQSALPVFNSHAIESQLHHISGLSEKYIYLNDDIMFLRPTHPSRFFTGNGQSKYFPSRAPLDIDAPSARDLPVLSAAKRNRAFVAKNHGRVVTNKFKHTPHPQLRSVLEEMEAEHQDMFDRVQRSKFRHPDDHSIPSALYHFHAYALRRAQVGAIRYAYLDISRIDAPLVLQRLARRRDLDVVCLNDTNSDADAQEALSVMLREFLDERFPVQSSFEKEKPMQQNASRQHTTASTLGANK